MRMTYTLESATACKWYVLAQGLEGPDGPNSESNEHNGGWFLPGRDKANGTLSVPAGPGSVHTAVFRSGILAKPGMFVDFDLTRVGDRAADTCPYVTIAGLQLSY
jgi:hypothetical protein